MGQERRWHSSRCTRGRDQSSRQRGCGRRLSGGLLKQQRCDVWYHSCTALQHIWHVRLIIMIDHFKIDHLSNVKSTITGHWFSKQTGLSTGQHGAFLNLKQSEPCLAWGILSFASFTGSALVYGIFRQVTDTYCYILPSGRGDATSAALGLVCWRQKAKPLSWHMPSALLSTLLPPWLCGS